MSPEKDKALCEKYPKIFKNRFADMQTTAMCWGFECGDGWYNIIYHLCGNIQGHIDWKRKERARALRYNRALRRALKGDRRGLEKYYSYKGTLSVYGSKQVEEDIQSAQERKVPESVRQVVAVQVKEKFGGLRFYYEGGDEYINGLSAMAESLSYVTCEECGSPGMPTEGGWIRTLCETHKEQN